MKRLKSIFIGIFLFSVVFVLVVAANTEMKERIDQEWPSVGSSATEQTASAVPQTVPEPPQPAAASPVYFTSEISPAGLMRVFRALGVVPIGETVAVKLSTGETGSNYLAPALIGELVQYLNATIVECNTAYGGQRAATAMHYQLAEEHGYTDIANVVILDETGSVELPVVGGTHLQRNRVGARFPEFSYYVILSHFKGHAMAGYGGALKNISIGLASAEGKSLIHTAGKSTTTILGGDQNAFLESMAEAAQSVVSYQNGKILYINVMNKLSVDCDCDSAPAAPTMQDIGILSSLDPVALDQACLDLVYSAPDGQDLTARIESKNGLHLPEAAQALGVGSRTYTLHTVDG